MKKCLALLLTLVCLVTLVACKTEGNEVQEYFVGKVTNISNNGTSCVVDVTDSGSSNLKVGDNVIVQTDFEGSPEYSAEHHPPA